MLTQFESKTKDPLKTQKSKQKNQQQQPTPSGRRTPEMSPFPPFFLLLSSTSLPFSLHLFHCRSAFSRVDTAQLHFPIRQQPTTTPVPTLARPNTFNSPSTPVPRATVSHEVATNQEATAPSPQLTLPFPIPPTFEFPAWRAGVLQVSTNLNPRCGLPLRNPPPCSERGATRNQPQFHPSEPFPTPTPHNHKHNHPHKTKTGGKEFEGTPKPLSSVRTSHPAKKIILLQSSIAK